jgi:predicted nuclease of predicted toxin-antitoxin system
MSLILGLLRASDDTIFDRSASGGYVLITADSDFGDVVGPARGEQTLGGAVTTYH